MMKKATWFIFSFILNMMELFVWIFLFRFVVYLNVKFFLREKGENNGKSEKNLSRQ